MKKILLFSLILILYNNNASAQRSINFAGIEWYVRNGVGGPGPVYQNNWSDSSNSVWVDSNGHLHLKIRKVGSIWYCADIYSNKSFGYGEYRFYVASNVENFDPNIVVGLFTYEADDKEIDIEFTGAFNNSSTPFGWFTVQPKLGSEYTNNDHIYFPLNLSGKYTTHKFIWNSNNIFFQSYHGHYATIPNPAHDYLIKQWTYKGNNYPPVGNERLHINFWLYKANPPSDGREAELIINAVYVPPGSQKSNPFPQL